MPDGVLNAISYDKYFVLLDRLIPSAAGFVVCDTKGAVVASHGRHTDVPIVSYLHGGPDGQSNGASGVDARVYTADDGSTIVRTDLTDSTGQLHGMLIACMGSDYPLKGALAVTALSESIRTTAACIMNEYELTSELNAMAQELAGRYEELNLVYETNDDIVEYEREGDIINLLLRNCIEYLDVGMVSLVFPEQEKVHYAVSETDPVEAPYPLVRHFSGNLYNSVKAGGEQLIINDLTDDRRIALSLDIPYKVIVSPVFNAHGAVIAILVCLNHPTRPDFYNSDKNLMEVMARKLSKIIQAHHDVMTGLVNLHAFKYVLNDAVDTSHRKGVSYVYLNIDIDQLSVINDTMGREAGDRAIKLVSVLLKERLRASDIVGYLGEGRFGVVLEMCTPDQGIHVAGDICDSVSSQEYFSRESDLDLTVSVGMALIGPEVHDIDAVFEAAELARDAAKESGGNQVKVFRQDNSELTGRKELMQWVSRIQKAMRNNEFSIYCQEIRPTVANDDQYHFEILLRMIGDDGEIIKPGDFIPTAERYSLMPAVDRWVIDNTFAILGGNGLAQHAREGVVSINLSGQSLADEGLVDYIAEMFIRYELVPDCICFEITETTAFGNMRRAKDIIERVSAMGCHFSLDDFGTGLSSFSYLKELPVDYLKIDGSFVRSILEDRISHAMVSSINQIGHVMGLKTVAEYVINDDVRKQLEAIGIDYLQGYSVGKPVPLEDYIADAGLFSVSRAG